MTSTTPRRRITLHFSHMGLTEARTFTFVRFLFERLPCRPQETGRRALNTHGETPARPGDVSRDPEYSEAERSATPQDFRGPRRPLCLPLGARGSGSVGPRPSRRS